MALRGKSRDGETRWEAGIRKERMVAQAPLIGSNGDNK